MYWRRRIVIGVVITMVILAIGYGFRPAPIYVDVAKVMRAPLKVTVEEEGKTRVIDRFVISAPVGSYARRIELNVGDSVSKGRPLLQLEPLRSAVLDPRSRAEAKARVAATKDLLSAAQEKARASAASAGLARTNLKRIIRLRKNNHVTQDELDHAQAENKRSSAELRSANFAVEVARHELEAAKTALQYSAAQTTSDTTEQIVISSPIDGSVLKVHRESEGVVNAGQALIEVGNAGTLEVEVDVLSIDAVRIKPGSRVLFNRWGGNQALQGVVRLVEPVGFTKISALGVEEQRVSVIIDIVSPAELWARLGDGYRVEASFILWEKQDVLQIPASALFHYEDGWAVFIVQDDRAQHRVVTVGQRNGLVAQIIDGISIGEMVVTHPDNDISDGARLRIR